jgi:hypothetical protein
MTGYHHSSRFSFRFPQCVSLRSGLNTRSCKQKDRPKTVSEEAGVQAARNARPFCFRRYAMKPTPKKPRITIAQVEGSGTAAMSVPVPKVSTPVSPTINP